MTGMSFLFTSYSVCSGKYKVWIADCSLFSIVGQGNIPITPNISLSSVLHVPKFSLNLLSISHITKGLNCCVTFFLSNCVFQNMVMWKTIGLEHEKDALYLLDSCSVVITPEIKRVVSASGPNELLTWHRCLGHFSVLKKMFP